MIATTWQNVIENIDKDPDLWIRAFEAKYEGKGEFTKADWDQLLGLSQACCDLPAAVFSPELAALYPEAKVVILNRDPDSWYESMVASVGKAMNPSGLGSILNLVYTVLFDPQTRNWMRFSRTMARQLPKPGDRAGAIAWFKERYAEFREKIPAERRIEFSVKDGWAPLCEYLGVPVPMIEDEHTGRKVEAPFPHVNDRAAFAANFVKSSARARSRANTNLVDMAGRVCLTGALGYGGYLAWKTRLGGRV